MVARFETGFTLIEMMVVIGLMALIGGAGTSAIYTSMRHTVDGNNEIMVVRQAQGAGDWISRDVQTVSQGGTVTKTAGGWPSIPVEDYIAGNWVTRTISYRTDAQGKLWRDVTNPAESKLVAEYIVAPGANSNAPTYFDTSTGIGIWRLKITANNGGFSATRIYEIKRRLD